jgi:hypothetical protein
VSDRDPETLSALLEAGIKPGTFVTLNDSPSEDQNVNLSVGAEAMELSWEVVQGIRVVQSSSQDDVPSRT